MIDRPPAWLRALDDLTAEPWRRLMILGARDVGKSTFCRALADRLSEAGEPVRLLDADLGQKLVGPPACVTLARHQAGEFVLERLRFVGETNPALNIAGVVAACARLADQAGEGRLIINTSGLIGGPGLALKRWKIEALAPARLVAIARGAELAPLLAAAPPPLVVDLAPSAAARRKSAAQRAAARAAALAQVFKGATRQAFIGVTVEELRREPAPAGEVRLCGLSDAGGEDLGLGLVQLGEAGSDPWVHTAVPMGRVWRARLGMPVQAGTISLPR